FAQTNSAGAALQRRLHGKPLAGGNGDCGWAILRPNLSIKKVCEHRWVVAKLTVLCVDEEDGRGGLSTCRWPSARRGRRRRGVEKLRVIERRLGWLQDFVTEVLA